MQNHSAKHFFLFLIQHHPSYRRRVNQNHFFYLSMFLAIVTLAFNRLFLPSDWANSEAGHQFVELVSRFYPGLSDLKKNWMGYTPQQGVLFSLMWTMMPIHWLLGFFGAFFLDKERFEKIIVQSPWKYFLPTLLICALLTVIPIFHPHISGYGRHGSAINQASNSLFVLAYSWLLINMVIHSFGHAFGALFIKLNKDTFNKEDEA